MALVYISWAASPGATGYKIYAGRTLGGPYSAPGSPTDVGNVTIGAFDINASGFWVFAVSAYNAFGEGFSGPELSGWFFFGDTAGLGLTEGTAQRPVGTVLRTKTTVRGS